MAGYGLKSFLIAQSLNQIEKAYGPNNAILDNCHVRVSFATNDERTAKRVSDALGTATELRAMKNYAGHRLSPWLGHLMVSRQETARPLLTPGEVMQLPPGDEIVLVSGLAPIRAKKARYYEDPRLTARILPPPQLERIDLGSAPGAVAVAIRAMRDYWTALPASQDEAAGSGRGSRQWRHSPRARTPEHEEIAQEEPSFASAPESFLADDTDDDEAIKARVLVAKAARSPGRRRWTPMTA